MKQKQDRFILFRKKQKLWMIGMIGVKTMDKYLIPTPWDKRTFHIDTYELTDASEEALQAAKIARRLSFSTRGELEITDVNKKYLEKEQLKVQLLGRGFAWMDAGTHEALFEASEFVKNIQDRQGFKLACLEEIAFYMGNISKETLYEKGKSMEKNDYGKYLMEIANRKHSEQYWESIDQNPVLGLVENE